ncbi:MAG: DUF3418 domain-containing protein, partial [Candidatus Aminicenantes bacterium]|nr:DUF3418 domain-containing protein [Candidatus Aminicenantes bacterium]
LVAEAEIAKFYSARLPGIHDLRTLRKLLKDRGGDDAFLRLEEDALLNYRPEGAAVSAFPDSVEVAGRPFRAVYKFAPGEEDDGVTLTVPPELLSAIPAERLEWGVPGQYRDKIAALVKGLPKRYRKLLVPVGEKAEMIAREMPQAPEEVPLFKAVAEFVKRRFGADIPPREWALADVPRYLRMRVAVTDSATGRVIDAGRDVELLRKKIGAADQAPSKVESPAWREAVRAWEKTGLTAWTFGDLPERVPVGTSLTAYPALVVEPETSGKGTVGIRLFAMRAEAAAAHPAGVRWLLLRKFGKELAFVRRYHKIPAEFDRAALYFGGREAVEKAIEEALARDVFERDIRTQAEYAAYEAEVGRTLFEKGHALTQTTLKVFSLNASIRAELGKGSGGGAGKSGAAGTSAAKTGGKTLSLYELSKLKERVTPEYLDAINADLDRLVPKNFLQIHTVARLVRIPRYIEGLKIRLERSRIGPEKDKAKAAQVEPYVFELTRLEAELRKPGQGIASPNSEKRLAVEELRWMIEEFKLALFAPEIKAAFPISAVRLAKKIREIDAIVV